MKIFCVGRNYSEHARELNNPEPEKPIIFLKPDTSLLKNNQPFFYPDFSNEIHYETELVVKINRVGKNISERFANRYYSEVAIGIDFTARDLQSEFKQKGLPWELSKAFDYSAPISNFFNLSEVGEIQNINFSLKKNNVEVQKSNTSEMIFSVDYLISFISKYFTIKIGDIIFTGTPAGVGRVYVGNRLQAYLNDICVLDFLVK
ncbi:MAG: fumarylacetoacetate hydrolase family protein [Bacteroidota bacterium]